MSRRKVDAVRQSWRSGEGEGRGRVSALLHCLFTLIDDGYTLQALRPTSWPYHRGRPVFRLLLARETQGKTRRGWENGWPQLYLQIPRVGSAFVEGRREGRRRAPYLAPCAAAAALGTLTTSSRRCTAHHKEYQADSSQAVRTAFTHASNPVTGSRRAHSTSFSSSPPPRLAAIN